MTPVVSVVVAAKDSAGHLPHLIEALREQTFPAEAAEFVIVDGGSSDDTRAVAEASGIFKVIAPDSHVGLPTARNLGARASRAPIIAFTDADCRPHPQWLEAGV